MIALTASGILMVLLIWLYGSYRGRQELFLGSAERSLFNVIQNYYQREVLPEAKDVDSTGSGTGRQRYLLSFVGKVYPELDLSPLKTALDTVNFQRHRRDKPGGVRKDDPDQLLPSYLLEKISFNEEVLDELKQMLQRSLKRNNMSTDFELFIQTMSREELEAYFARNPMYQDLVTRPILVNPDNGQFLIAKFDNPWAYLLRTMWWQVLFSVLLLAALIGTFLYLLQTIKRQHELAQQRKSFVNNMTHELKTPVATVMAAVEAIQRFGAKGDKDRTEKYLHVSKQELEHLNNVVERLLQMDHDDVRGVPLIKQDMDIVGAVTSGIETAQMSAKKETLIDLITEEERLFVHADEAHMKSVISNLLDNAIKYSGERATVAVHILDKGGLVEIRVEDKGKGIDMSQQKHIFDMFYRVSEGHLHEVKGFGIGLAYVKQVIQQHGGEVGVESAIGRGSTFTVKFPKK